MVVLAQTIRIDVKKLYDTFGAKLQYTYIKDMEANSQTYFNLYNAETEEFICIQNKSAKVVMGDSNVVHLLIKYKNHSVTFALSYEEYKCLTSKEKTVSNLTKPKEKADDEMPVSDMKQQLIAIIRNARMKHTYCSSSGEPISSYTVPVVENDMVEEFADYLINNGVTLKVE